MLLSEFAAPTGVMPVSISMESTASALHPYGPLVSISDAEVLHVIPITQQFGNGHEFLQPCAPSSQTTRVMDSIPPSLSQPPTKFAEIITPELPTSAPPTKFAAFSGPDLPTSPPPTKFAAIVGPDLPTSPPPTK